MVFIVVGAMLSSLVVLVILCASARGVPIDTRLEDYCKTLLAVYEKNPESELVQGIIEPWVCRSLDAMEESDYFLPKVLIWCPLTRFKLVLKCPTHGTVLRNGVWKVSTKMSCEPRLLFDLDGNTLLIARYYVCSCRGIYHRILSSDQVLREQVQRDVEIPFILAHRSGYTLRFLTHVRVEIGLGINFSEISQSLKKINLDNFVKRRDLMLLLYNYHNKQPSPKYLDETEFTENPLYAHPSDDHIREMFLLNFRHTRAIYESDMKKLSATSVSMFHTFKVCSVVGTTRSMDDRWIAEYKGLFVVTNERSEIIKWSFCVDDSFEEIRVLLLELSGRLGVQGRQLTHAMVGSCCAWRPMLLEIFGGNLLVKQDLFQIAQVLRNNFEIQAPEKTECLEGFEMVFRGLDDKGPERLKPTPDPDVLNRQLDEFMARWESSFNREVLDRLEVLKLHIGRGCLSGIPVGHGVHKTEDLNQLMNKSLIHGATRIGPELAFALITVLFYIVNGKLRRRKQLYDVYGGTSTFSKELEGEAFGFLPNVTEGYSSSTVTDQPSLWQSSEAFDRQDPMDYNVLRASVQSLLREDVLQVLVPKSLELHDMLQKLATRCTLKTFNVWDLPSIGTEKSLLLLARPRTENDVMDESEHSSRLDGRLEQFSLELESVEKDGNCAFTAVALQIKHVLDRGADEEFRDLMYSLDLRETMPTQMMAQLLRSIFIREITTNVDEYYPCTHDLTEEMYMEEAKAFQLDGVFTSQLGDFIMKALSKVLCSAILVITSMPSVEVIPFIPDTIKSKTPLFVAFNQAGPGHYDSTVDRPKNDSASDGGGSASNVLASKYASTQGKCRCGSGKVAGDGSEALSCTNKADTGRTGKYLTRCPCYRLQQGCTAMCRCVNCGNEYTTQAERMEMSRERVLKRKRNLTESIKRKKAEDFINDIRLQTPASQSAWSSFESCVLEAALRFLDLSGLEHSPENVVEMYNFIAKSTSVSSMGLSLRCKTITQVECKLNARKATIHETVLGAS